MRPGMYIGSTSKEGLHHPYRKLLITQLMRPCGSSHIQNLYWADGSFPADDGRSIPVDIPGKTGRPAVETVFTVSSRWRKESLVADIRSQVVSTE